MFKYAFFPRQIKHSLSLSHSAIKDHLYSCFVCSNIKHSIKSFRILRQCTNNYDTKINEALLIKRYKPELTDNYLITERLFF